MNLSQKKIIVPIFILIMAMLIGFIWYTAFESKYRNYQTATAVITNYYVTYGTRAGSRMYHWDYSYSVNGAEYSDSDQYRAESGESRVGDTVTVWYDPENPSDSTMNTSASLEFIAPLFLALPLMLGAYSHYSKQELKGKLS